MDTINYAQADRQIFEFLLARREAGEPCALVTVIDIERTGPRPKGAHMAVSLSGDRVGYVSSGCLEEAVTNDAVATIKEEANRIVLYGENSPYVDFKLPCGGGMTFYIHVEPDLTLLKQCLASLKARQPFSLAIEPKAGKIDLVAKSDVVTGWSGDKFMRRYAPPLQFVLVGRGAELDMMTRLTAAAGYTVYACSPDPVAVPASLTDNVSVIELKSPSYIPPIPNDPWTAFVFLFHDHELEYTMIKAALQGPAFYIGALGSKRTHATRLEYLRDMGVDEASLKRIRGPMGLISAARDPVVLSISVMAEVVDAFRAMET